MRRPSRVTYQCLLTARVPGLGSSSRKVLFELNLKDLMIR